VTIHFARTLSLSNHGWTTTSEDYKNILSKKPSGKFDMEYLMINFGFVIDPDPVSSKESSGYR